MEFHLSESFLDSYAKAAPNFTPLGFVVFKRTYARPIEEENRTEEWWETVRRVVEGCYSIQKLHCKQLRVYWNDHKAQKSAQEMYRLIYNFKFLPPGRGLWMMGTKYMWERGGAALNNCGFTSTKDINVDFVEPFCFLMDMSMLGVGVAFDAKGAGILKIKEPYQGDYIYQVADTREGWVDLIRIHLNAYVHKNSLPASVDYSAVRPYGTPIKGFGGTASGPQPLMELIEDIHQILKPLVGQPITSRAIVDLFNAIGRCVVSGNVRRSAELALGDPTDTDYLDLKNREVHTGEELAKIDRYRWASNNSVRVTVGTDYTDVAQRTSINGEPGYFWLENARKYGRFADPPNYIDELAEGTNPCSEQTLWDRELCCLVETFPAHHESFEEYQRTLKFAYLYAKTVTLLPTHNERTNAVLLRNRRIGTSMSGIVQAINKFGFRELMNWCDNGYQYLKKMDKIYSDWFCIPMSIKVTSVKPSGTVSLLCGATSGMHYPHSEYYWRTVRFDKGSDMVKALQEANYKIVDGETPTTAIVYFPCKEKNFSRSKEDVSIWEQLELAAQLQHWWADNQVSVTISFKSHETSDIKRALEMFETRLKSVSFLPLDDHGYENAPYQKISKEEYEEASKNLLPVVWKTAETDGYKKGFCDNDVCEIPVKK